MPLNAASHAEDLAVKAGKPRSGLRGKDGRPRRGWKGFYGSVHDIVSSARSHRLALISSIAIHARLARPWVSGRADQQDGDLDLISDASISLAAHGQYMSATWRVVPYKLTIQREYSSATLQLGGRLLRADIPQVSCLARTGETLYGGDRC